MTLPEILRCPRPSCGRALKWEPIIADYGDGTARELIGWSAECQCDPERALELVDRMTRKVEGDEDTLDMFAAAE